MLNSAYEFDSERPPVREAARSSAHNDTGLFFACPDVDAAYEELRAKVPALKKPAVTGYGMKQLSLSDPDGYYLCFQWRANAPRPA